MICNPRIYTFVTFACMCKKKVLPSSIMAVFVSSSQLGVTKKSSLRPLQRYLKGCPSSRPLLLLLFVLLVKASFVAAPSSSTCPRSERERVSLFPSQGRRGRSSTAGALPLTEHFQCEGLADSALDVPVVGDLALVKARIRWPRFGQFEHPVLGASVVVCVAVIFVM